MAQIVHHDSFVIERVFDATPAQLFRAWADPAVKQRWFGCVPDWEPSVHQLDFRIGGRETNRTGPKGGPVHWYDARYVDIVPDSRIILAYTMTLDKVRISASLLTVALVPEVDGSARTRLILTEQIAVLDSRYPVSGREEGTRGLLDSLDAELRRAA